MPFCPICESFHDRDVLCIDKTTQALRDMGIKKKKPSKDKFKILIAQADMSFMKILLDLVALVLLGFFVMKMLER
jgi:F0F1-type ATP synthase assembly protein I